METVHSLLDNMADVEGAKIEPTLSSSTLFVRNLPFVFDNNELEKVFSEVGPVKRCFVVKDKDNPNKCRGFGYVTFALRDDAIQAQEKIRQVKGRKLFVTFSKKKPRHIERGPPKKKSEEELKEIDSGNEEIENAPVEATPLSASSDKPKHKPKSKRTSAMNDDGRTVVLTGFPSSFNIRQLKKACKKNGEIEQFYYPVENQEEPMAHAVYKSHKDARIAVIKLNGKTVKGEVLNALLRSKENKTFSQKSLKKSRLIVRNLPFKCGKEFLMEEFAKFGQVSEVVMPTKMTGKRKKKLGFAFVQFNNVFDAAKAVQGMNQKEIKGRPIAVDWTLPKKKYELLKVDEEDSRKSRLLNEKEQTNDIASEDSDAEGKVSDGEDELDGNPNDFSAGNCEDLNNEDEYNEISEDDDNTDMDNSDDEDISPAKKKRKLRDAREGKTLFVRNLPFDAGQEEICELFEEFGELAYCKIVVNSVTEHSRGSAFVKFQKKESADECLKRYGDEVQGSEELTMRKRRLSVTVAVTKGKISQLLSEKDATKKKPRDKRNLYLAKEGVISAGSEAAVGLSRSDLQKRQKAEAEKKAKLKLPHFIVSKTRLCFRNLPLNVDDKKLSELLRTVCGGKPKMVGKVRIMRNMERLDISGVGRSKGFGFAEFSNHEDALEVLRAMNNNPEVFSPDRRPIVEFAIENSLILKSLEQRKAKNVRKNQAGEKERELNSNQTRGKREYRKRKRLNKKDQVLDCSAATTAHSNEISSSQLEHNLNASKKMCVFSNDKSGKKDSKTRVLASKNMESSEGVASRNKRVEMKSKLASRVKQKQKDKVDKEEEKFNEIVEKYKTKLFGKNTKQFRTSRWFNT